MFKVVKPAPFNIPNNYSLQTEVEFLKSTTSQFQTLMLYMASGTISGNPPPSTNPPVYNFVNELTTLQDTVPNFSSILTYMPAGTIPPPPSS
jgi:hypothetical protein